MFGKIVGTGSYLPNRVLTNEDLTKYVDTDDEWIVERTGIEQRHVMAVDETTVDMAVMAAQRAIESAQISAEEIDLIILSSVSANVILPNAACVVQSKIGAINAGCFDINSACTGFLTAYNIAQSQINTGLINTALIIGAEGLSRLVDWNDRGTCILFGDGAGAAIIKKDESAVFETVIHADGSQGRALTMDTSFSSRVRAIDSMDNAGRNDGVNQFISMDGQSIFRFAVRQVPACIQELLDKMEITSDDVDLFILHQANKRILQSIAKRLKVDEKKVPINLMNSGNTSSACIPILLDELARTGKIHSGDRVVMSGFGAGLTWGATYFTW
ncbi:MAG: ketoacyl-ACP synthase III [Lachnospiraceae bacterium]|nr:ketoacyl-ACP synthase III [Lachnospiraceae bacterium]